IIQLTYDTTGFDNEIIMANHLMYKEIFYSCAIDLLEKFDFKDQIRLDYIVKNIADGIELKNKKELIDALRLKSVQSNIEDRILSIGFRAIYTLLDDNFESITAEYIREVNRRLSPFFFAFKNKDALLSGYGISRNYEQD
ncbi:MAG: hypothetical protein RSH25_12945, partial [Bacteroides sp.]